MEDLENAALKAAKKAGYNPDNIVDIPSIVYYKDAFKKGAEWQKAQSTWITVADQEPEELKIEDLEVGKIYHVSFCANTQVLGRFKEVTATDIKFFSYLHYWNGYENFYVGGYCVQSGIEELRRATQAEKMALVRFEIERDCI